MRHILPLTLACSILSLPAVAAGLPDEVAVPNDVLVATAQAVGAQIYQCKSDQAGKMTWQFREPIASLFIDGKTVGRHYAGPNWEMADGSVVNAKVSGRAAAESPRDIPLLKLDVVARRGAGQLASVTTILRINTRGGVADGACDADGAFLSVPYTADYALYRKRD